MFVRRLGPDPHASSGSSTSANSCPDVWELSNGDFAVIGVRKTGALMSALPSSAGCGPDEEIVVIPRQLLIGLKSDIPQA